MISTASITPGTDKIVLAKGDRTFETKTLAGGIYRLRLTEDDLAEIPEADRTEWKVIARGTDDSILSETASEITLKPSATVVLTLVAPADRLVLAVPDARSTRPARPARPVRPDRPARPVRGGGDADDPDGGGIRDNPLSGLVTELDGFTAEMADRLVAEGFDTLSKVTRARNADLAPILGVVRPADLRSVIRRIRERG